MIEDILLKQAAEKIKAGQLVAFPTETVYGLGADARNKEAVQSIFTIKGRPSFNPLIVHTKNIETLETIAIINNDAEKLLTTFSPGPLTLVLPLKSSHNIAENVTAGLNTVAVRIPSHPIARKLIELSECPIAAPSANLSGYISATDITHVVSDFYSHDILILPNDDSIENELIGLESTIIDVTTDQPLILRYGFITPSNIAEILGKEVNYYSDNKNIKAPGMLLKHYSPKTSIRLNAIKIQDDEIGLNFANSQLLSQYSLNLSKNGSLTEAAHNLYYMLRKLDDYASNHQISGIAVAPIPSENIGLAINDRLKRASIST